LGSKPQLINDILQWIGTTLFSASTQNHWKLLHEVTTAKRFECQDVRRAKAGTSRALAKSWNSSYDFANALAEQD
jgi:hypothetical protein